MSYVKIALLIVFGMIFGLKASAQAELDLSAIRLPHGISLEIWLGDDQNGVIYRISYSRSMDEGVALLSRSLGPTNPQP